MASQEYRTFDGGTVEYDNAVNLYEDEDDYRYFYDFENRLIRIESFYSGAWATVGIETGTQLVFRS